MSRESKRRSQKVGVRAWKGCQRNLGDVCVIGIVNLIARIVAISPLLLLTFRSGAELADWGGVFLACLIWALLVIPLRCWSGEKMRRVFFSRNQPKRAGIPYKKWLVTGLLRLMRGLLWGLPFLACVGYFVIGYGSLSVTDMWRPIQNLPTILGMEASLQTGLIMAGIIMALLALLFAYGWWRDMPVEYLPIRSLGAVKTIHWARRMRKHHKDPLRKNALANFLLSLPGVIGMGAVAVPYLLRNIDFSGAMALTNSVKQLTHEWVPQTTVVAIGLVFVLVYFPLLMYRKMRNAAVVGQLMKGQQSGHGSQGGSSSAAR